MKYKFVHTTYLLHIIVALIGYFVLLHHPISFLSVWDSPFIILKCSSITNDGRVGEYLMSLPCFQPISALCILIYPRAQVPQINYNKYISLCKNYSIKVVWLIYQPTGRFGSYHVSSRSNRQLNTSYHGSTLNGSRGWKSLLRYFKMHKKLLNLTTAYLW